MARRKSVRRRTRNGPPCATRPSRSPSRGTCSCSCRARRTATIGCGLHSRWSTRGKRRSVRRGKKRRSAVYRRRRYLRVLLELSSAVHGRYSQRQQVTEERGDRKDRREKPWLCGLRGLCVHHCRRRREYVKTRPPNAAEETRC